MAGETANPKLKTSRFLAEEKTQPFLEFPEERGGQGSLVELQGVFYIGQISFQAV